MNPIYLILFAVIVTLLLTLAIPRLRPVSPTGRRFLWVAMIAGLVVLLVIIVLAMTGN